MANYCCFIDPQSDYSEKELSDIGPSGFCYGFPIFNPPLTIGSYNVLKALSRGFYGATYIVKDDLQQKKVLKVIPKNVYHYFGKDFKNECIMHANVASDSEHIVGINSMFDSNIYFPDIINLDCHIAVLDYVNGKTLEEILKEKRTIDASKIAQIAVDLFKLLSELNKKKTNHNDLHSGNLIIKELDESNKRSEELNNFIKIIAIDFGSLSEESKSNLQRMGDIHRISEYLRILSKRLLDRPEEINDNEYRLAYLLEEQATLLASKVENQTIIGFTDAIEAIKGTFRKTYYPWKDQLELKSFGDSYNAQTLQPWFVPSLLVDPEDKWTNQISSKGPLLITGMRGCGKTMLLRALQFHARAVPNNEFEKGNSLAIEDRLKSENFIGLYVSSRKLLDKLGKPTEEPLFEPFSRLFIAYALEAIRTIRHLGDISFTLVNSSYYNNIKGILFSILKEKSILEKVNSDTSLENCLIDILFSLSKGEDRYIIEMSPSNAFPILAEAIKKCSPIWRNHYVLFLLDDVSTRYFYEKNISDLLSSLIFQSENCAFKITSEAQSIEVILNSPGNIEKARLGRDLESFDLGKEVYEKIRDGGINNGIKFIENILLKRAKYYTSHPSATPSILLGNNFLASIAKDICNISENLETKNKIYYGISALAGICVGDIGEVINLYDSILKHYDNATPINPVKQSECYRDLSSIRLFQLNRIKSEINLKDFALAFAEASHELLINSYKFTPTRLRQYYSIYVQITSGTKEEQDIQFNKLIELIDAGIFVFAGGSISPRISSSDTNPIKQFVLIYRKLYGITNLIGLQQADRFELNGDRLIEFLNNPKKGKEILMRGLGNKYVQVIQSPKPLSIRKPKITHITPNLFDNQEIRIPEYEKEIKENILINTPTIKIFEPYELEFVNIDLLIIGLGFEERALQSVIDIFDKNITVLKALCIEYAEIGEKDSIIKVLVENGISYEIITYQNFISTSYLKQDSGLNILCNVSGLSKSLIFKSINSIYNNDNIIFSHSFAKEYYPLDIDIERYLNDCNSSEFSYELLETITSDLVKGESGPYKIEKMLSSNTDDSKKRVLIAFASSKYERLFTLIDEREYEIIELITPIPQNPRTKLARIAAEIVSKRFNHVVINEFDTNSLQDILTYLYQKFYEYYVVNNYNIEIALTGSKRQTIICSFLSSILKISNCWYINPSSWDTERFSKGMKETTYFKINPAE